MRARKERGDHRQMRLPRRFPVLLVALLALVLAPTAVADPVIMAAGDISCGGGATKPTTCQSQQTADLLAAQRASPEGLAAVLALGDNQYDSGSLRAYTTYFAPTWGRFDDILHPAVGNHEYNTPGAQGYYDYFLGVGRDTGRFGERGKGYYSFDVGGWHLIALNS